MGLIVALVIGIAITYFVFPEHVRAPVHALARGLKNVVLDLLKKK